MFASKHLEDLAKKLCSVLPSGIKSIETELQQQFKDILQSAFDHMDLVTREEFDIQIKVLARTREKIDQLQSQVNTLLNQS